MSENLLDGELHVTDDEMRGKYLTFWTDSQLYGVPIADVVQIVGLQEITKIPEFPSYAKGVINLRGIIIPVIDIRLRLDRSEAEYNDRTCIIVTDIGESHFGFIVDEVDAVTDIDDEHISPPPQMGSESNNRYLTGVARITDDNGAEKLVLTIDTAKILAEEEYESLTQAAV